MRRRTLLLMMFAFATLLSAGCICNSLSDSSLKNLKQKLQVPESDSSPTSVQNSTYPYVFLNLTESQGYGPFWVEYTYWCYDDDLVSCELRIDGQSFAKGKDIDSLFTPNFTYPEFYKKVISTKGIHELAIIGIDAKGQVSSFSANFTVLDSAYLSEPGWYECNNLNVSPCDLYQQAYCNKFTPTEISIREAAAKAISNHPGKYSANQILDVYDWVYGNVFYQNVPVNLSYQPYAPAETLKTKSGDCKNHAVLIASMIESIGGTARVVLAPECQHAYAEVYIGNNASATRFADAIFAHYSKAPAVNWHTYNNGTEVWMPIDTAGGAYPGQTIKECWSVSQSFVMRDCSLTHGEKPSPPDMDWIEYGPFSLYQGNLVIEPEYWNYFTYTVDRSKYDYCTYEIKLNSKARLFDWYIIPASNYADFQTGSSFGTYYYEKQVSGSDYNLTLSSPDKFMIIIWNTNEQNAMTISTNIQSRCYKK